MFAGPPLPLHPGVPLQQLVALSSRTPGVLGVWLRRVSRPIGLHAASPCRSCRMLLSDDLGWLLGRCGHIALREGQRPRILTADQLIGWRALQVITGCPHLDSSESWQRIFPGAYSESSGFGVPVASRPPQEVLADCLAHGIEVKGTRIIYRAVSAASPVDVTLSPPLR
jgi:hypothetical protein